MEHKSEEEAAEFEEWLTRPLPERPHSVAIPTRRGDRGQRLAEGAEAASDPRADALRARLSAVQAMDGDVG